MSADFKMNCPICNGKNTVRVDHTHDIELFKDGTFTTNSSAFCTYCDHQFELKL